MSKGKRSTDAEFKLRVKEVLTWVLNGHDRKEIIQLGSKWDVTDRQIDDYISRADDELQDINTISLKKNIALISKNLWRIFRANIDTDPELARKVLMDLAKIKGIGIETVNYLIDRPTSELQKLNDDDFYKLATETH